MAFTPGPVGQTDLKYPEHRWKILFLSQSAKEAWYVAQDPQELIKSDKEFLTFWKRAYGWHVKIKRVVFWFKFW